MLGAREVARREEATRRQPGDVEWTVEEERSGFKKTNFRTISGCALGTSN